MTGEEQHDVGLMISAVRMVIQAHRDDADRLIEDIEALKVRANFANDRLEHAIGFLDGAIECLQDFDAELGDVVIGPDDI